MTVPLLRLASLDQIRGFVAVARRMSVKEAAQDLCLSNSAVSRQITSLEEFIGKPLFVRRHRAIELTPEGEKLFRVADNAVQQIQDVLGSLGAARDDLPVTITASVGVTALWLLPRLVRFQQRNPTVDVRFAASNKVLDLRTENVDLAIRYCAESAAPRQSVRLFGESIAPVAHPITATELPWGPEQLRNHVLIELDDRQHPWLQWKAYQQSQNWPNTQPKAVLRFNQYDQVIQAARAGQGIALGRMPLVRPLLEDGALVPLAEPTDPSPGYAYWLIQAEAAPRKAVVQLTEWIVAEAAASERPVHAQRRQSRAKHASEFGKKRR